MASDCPGQLQILHSGTVPKRLANLLPPREAGLLRDLSSVEFDSGQLSAALQKGPMTRPYWDPELRESPDHLGSVPRRLRDRKLVSFRRAYKAEVGIFSVKKKHDKIRMIIDCRQATFCHQTPPWRPAGFGRRSFRVGLAGCCSTERRSARLGGGRRAWLGRRCGELL